MALVPARYTGDSHKILKEVAGPYLDGEGRRRETNLLVPGDTLMMPDTEVYGFTYKHDPRGMEPSQFLGLGRNILSEHAGCSEQELSLHGYEFHEGRPDFAPLTPASTEPAKKRKKEE